MSQIFDEMMDALLNLVNTLAPYPQDQRRLLLKALFARLGEDVVGDVMRGVDTAKMRLQLKQMQRNPQKYARKMP